MEDVPAVPDDKSIFTEKWTADPIPDQSGRLAIVARANSGLGEVTAREFARAGARAVLACRNPQKGEAARRTIETAVPGAQLELEELDLASPGSVRALAERFRASRGRCRPSTRAASSIRSSLAARSSAAPSWESE